MAEDGIALARKIRDLLLETPKHIRNFPMRGNDVIGITEAFIICVFIAALTLLQRVQYGFETKLHIVPFSIIAGAIFLSVFSRISMSTVKSTNIFRRTIFYYIKFLIFSLLIYLLARETLYITADFIMHYFNIENWNLLNFFSFTEKYYIKKSIVILFLINMPCLAAAYYLSRYDSIQKEGFGKEVLLRVTQFFSAPICYFLAVVQKNMFLL